MSIRRLDRHEWQGFCIRMSHDFVGKRVAIEVASRDPLMLPSPDAAR
jgi:hypothetical protein